MRTFLAVAAIAMLTTACQQSSDDDAKAPKSEEQADDEATDGQDPADKAAEAGKDAADDSDGGAKAKTETAASGQNTAPVGNYKGTGTEPFWSTDISPGSMTYTPMDGDPITQTVTTVEPVAGGQRYIGHTVVMTVRRESCSDGMSDKDYAYSLMVTLAGTTLNGCATKN